MFVSTIKEGIMRIGMDISIAECRRSGYMVMDFKKRELFKNGKLDKDCPVIFSVSNPYAWNDAGKPMINSDRYGNQLQHNQLWLIDNMEYSWNDLMEMLEYGDRMESVASCCDWEHCKPNFDNPNEYDLLHLASDISCCVTLGD
jgi:hypothetical protein